MTRNLYIDFIKGIAISFVIWGHCIQYGAVGAFNFFENSIYRFIYTFHMPLFMMLSGYLFSFSLEKRTLGQLLKHRIVNIGICIVSWNTIQFLLSIFIMKNFTLERYFDTLGGLWFLWSILACSIVVAFVCKQIRRKYHFIFFVFLMPVVFLFPNGNMNLFMYPYFVAGYLFRQYENKVSAKYVLYIKQLCLGMFPVMVFLYELKHYIYISGVLPQKYAMITQIEIDLFRWMIGFVGSIFILYIAQFIIKKFQHNNIVENIARVGALSLHIYVIQRLFLESIGGNLYKKLYIYLGYNPFAQNILVYNFIITPLLSAAIVYFTYKLSVKISKNKLLNFILFGR